MSEERYSGYVGYCKCGSLVMGVLDTTDEKSYPDVLHAIKSGLHVEYVRGVPAQVLEPCKCKQVLQQNTPQLSDARKDLLRLRDGLEALYNYKDWEKIDNRKIKKQEIRAKNVLRALNEYEKRHSKYPLAPVSSTLDRLLDSRFDLAAAAEADLGEIEHKGEKVMVKIKVVRGE